MALRTAAFPELRLRNAQIEEVKCSRGRRASLSARPRRLCAYMAPRGAESPRDVIQVKSQAGAREPQWKSASSDNLQECFVR